MSVSFKSTVFWNLWYSFRITFIIIIVIIGEVGLLTSTDLRNTYFHISTNSHSKFRGQNHKFQFGFSAFQSSMSLKSSWNSSPPPTWPWANIYKVFHIPSTGRWRGKTDHKFWCTLSPSKLPGCNFNIDPSLCFYEKLSALENCRCTDGHFLPLNKAPTLI